MPGTLLYDAALWAEPSAQPATTPRPGVGLLMAPPTTAAAAMGARQLMWPATKSGDSGAGWSQHPTMSMVRTTATATTAAGSEDCKQANADSQYRWRQKIQ